MLIFKSILLILAIVFIYIVGKKSINTLVNRIGQERHVPLERVYYVKKVIIGMWGILTAVALSVVAGWGYSDIGLFMGSIFAVIGVALFAQWSILSNITASIIVFFFFPYGVGSYVKILDSENSVEGTIESITLFHVILRGTENEIYTYPNTLVFQKTVTIINPARNKKEIPDNEE
ncbi:mechanosensitive ion channel [Shewanella sp. VB17]|uniref:mechanosensitive ion channel domain-containing protein n=1 Tax=Shewanella sp. VB17 TaxID=2739432 RepID=UPI001566A2C7|nr:mechanosensitive ion channel domain-containing protein [Shewanella sp. VB17]NRD74106.1 mechanosensitive ion channel [Shewanella sp. VB17]